MNVNVLLMITGFAIALIGICLGAMGGPVGFTVVIAGLGGLVFGSSFSRWLKERS